MGLIQLIYASEASHDFGTDELHSLLKTSRKNNAKSGVTGILLYKRGSFLQVLEGGEKDVDAIFDRILSDARHDLIILLHREDIPERNFEDWRMGFVDIEAVDLPGFSDLMTAGGSFPGLKGDASRVRKMIEGFQDGGMWRRFIGD